MAQKVTFVGEITGAKKIRLLEDHGLFVFTPVAPEGLPWVILEAMSAGLPVITSSQGAIAEVVISGVTGYIIEPSPASLAEAVCQLLDNPATAVAMGNAGRQRVAEAFSEDAYLQRLADLFHEVASRAV
jgi:glycosyltransferase involved in cell wall biosynthesis